MIARQIKEGPTPIHTLGNEPPILREADLVREFEQMSARGVLATRKHLTLITVKE